MDVLTEESYPQSLERARMGASLCKLSYDGIGAMDYNWANLFEGFTSIKHESDLIYVGYYKPRKEVWVIVRGTDDLRDLKNDMQCGMCESAWAPGHVHDGFIHTVEMNVFSVYRAIQSFADKGVEKVVFTGHSRGGAIAAIMASNLRFLSWKVDILTYGAPRYCDAEFAEYLENRLQMTLTAYELPKDPVTGVPPTTMGFAAPGIVQLTKTSRVTRPAYPTSDTPGYRKVLSDWATICRMIGWLLFPRIVVEHFRVRHSAQAYLDRINLLCRRKYTKNAARRT